MTGDNWLALFMLAIFAIAAYLIVTNNQPGEDDDSP